MIKPSKFKTFPMGSILKNCESEIVASNIMKILTRTGDEWRPLTLSEYERERKKDGDYSEAEEEYFNKVIGYCKSPDTALLFAPNWRSVVEKPSRINRKGYQRK